jgi:hypothetical protein
MGQPLIIKATSMRRWSRCSALQMREPEDLMTTSGNLLKLSLASLLLTLGPCLARAGDRLFVANENVPNAVRILDLGANTLVGTLDNTAWTSGGGGRYLSFSPDGHLWVSDDNSDCVYEFNEGLGFIRSLCIPGVDGPGSVAASEPGVLYITSFRNRTVFKYDLQNAQVIWQLELGSLEPNYLKIGHGGNLFITGSGGRRIEERERSDGRLVCTYSSGVSGPYAGIAFRDGTRFFAANTGDIGSPPQIEEYDASLCGAPPIREASIGVRPVTHAGLAMGRDGFLYTVRTTESGEGKVLRIDPDSFVVLAELSQGSLPLAGNQAIEFSPCSDSDGDGFTTCAGDCDDLNAAIHPGAPELCDGRDDNCDGITPADEADADGDGFRICQNDCNDSNPAIHPGAAELPGNLVDENCDGSLGACDPTTVWRNHGQFVRCVAHEVDALVAAGAITEAEGDFLTQSAAQSNVGKQ